MPPEGKRELFRRNPSNNKLQGTGVFVSTEPEEPPQPDWFNRLKNTRDVQPNAQTLDHNLRDTGFDPNYGRD